MPNALRGLGALMLVVALAGCHNDQPLQNGTADANVVNVEGNAAPPAEVEALPSDESSATPSNQLVNGDDAPDVNAGGETNSD